MLPPQHSFWTSEVAVRLRMVLWVGVLALPVAALSAQEKQSAIQDRDAESAVAAAQARALLARSEGKNELAAREWRKVLAYHEDVLKRVETLLAQGRICNPGEVLETRGDVSLKRVWLAEVEGRKDILRAELPKVIEYHEYRIQKYQRMLEFGVVSIKEAGDAIKVIHDEVKLARNHLASLKERSCGDTGP